MPTFHNKPEGFPAVRKKMIRRMIPLIFILILLGLIKSIPANGHVIQSFLFYGLLIAVVIYFTFRKVLRHQKKIYDSYRLTIDDVTISRTEFGAPEIVLAVDEILRIVEFPDCGLLIVTKDSKLNVKVSVDIIGYDRVKEILLDIHPSIIVLSRNFTQRYPLFLSTLIISLLLLVRVRYDWLAGLAVFSLILTFGICFGTIWKSKLLTGRQKLSYWWLILPFIGVLLTGIFRFVY